MAERKKYISAEIPILNEEIRILGTPEELNDKTIKLDLTRKLRGKGLTITFRIFNKDGKLVSIPNKLELVKAYIRRMMRKRIDYVEDSFRAQCADVRTIIKPFLITRKRVSRAVRKNLRNTAREFLLEYLKDKEYNDICKELIDGILQKAMLPKLKKVYPLSFCDIRVLETKELGKVDLDKIIKEAEEGVMVEAEDIQEIAEEAKEEVKEEAEEAKEEVKEEAEEAKEEVKEEAEEAKEKKPAKKK
jgi:ribosomal protein S3AE